MRRSQIFRRAGSAPARRGRALALTGPARRDLFVNDYHIAILSPDNGTGVNTRTPSIIVLPRSLSGDPLDVQIEWRQRPPTRDAAGRWTPEPSYVSTTTATPSDVELVLTPPTALPFYTWYYRVRAGSLSSGLWTDWTSPDRYIDLNPVLGSVAQYIDMNVGVLAVGRGTVAYVDMNIGAADTHYEAAQYTDLNVGILPRWVLDARYVDMNIYPPTGEFRTLRYTDFEITTDIPVPHIWWVRPEQGREGYVFHIYGHGFGDFQGQHGGSVFLGVLRCPVVRWVRVPAVFADDADRLIKHGQGLDPDEITVEHGWITVTVPVGAVSAMVKVVLEG